MIEKLAANLYLEGCELNAAGRRPEAIQCFRRALALKHDYIDVLVDLAGALQMEGIILHQAGHYTEADAIFREVRALVPGDQNTINMICTNLLKAAEKHLAINEIYTATSKVCESYELSGAQDILVRYLDILIRKTDGLRTAKDYINICSSIDGIEQVMYRIAEGAISDNEIYINIFSEAIRRLEDNGRANSALSLCNKIIPLCHYYKFSLNRMRSYLYLGDYAKAWDRNVWMSSLMQVKEHQWDGASRQKKIIVRNSGGLGDMIQFLRFIPFLYKFSDHIAISDGVLRSRRAIQSFQRLVRRSGYFGQLSIINQTFGIDPAASYCELWLLPMTIGISSLDGVLSSPYLFPDGDLYLRFYHILQSPDVISVGVVWSAPDFSNKRSIGLVNISRVFDVHAPIHFYSFQGTQGKAELNDIDIPDNFTDIGVHDLEYTGAMMKCMDIVITPDCGLAHISCALGVRTWIVVEKNCDWRWIDDDRVRLWYPTARVFRQRQQGNWDDVVEAIGCELAALRKPPVVFPSMP